MKTDSFKPFANTVTLDRIKENVLLILREDFRIWALPGGGLEPGETPEQAALRETLEESGFEIKIDRLVGKYYRPQFNDVRFVFQTRITGGQALKSGPETLAVKWFPVKNLPGQMAPSVREIIQDAVSVKDQPVEKYETYPWWKFTIRCVLLKLRNLRNRLQGKA